MVALVVAGGGAAAGEGAGDFPLAQAQGAGAGTGAAAGEGAGGAGSSGGGGSGGGPDLAGIDAVGQLSRPRYAQVQQVAMVVGLSGGPAALVAAHRALILVGWSDARAIAHLREEVLSAESSGSPSAGSEGSR